MVPDGNAGTTSGDVIASSFQFVLGCLGTLQKSQASVKRCMLLNTVYLKRR